MNEERKPRARTLRAKVNNNPDGFIPAPLKPNPAQYHDCPDCGYRISKEQREFAVVDLECPQCGGKKLSEFRESVQNVHDLPDTATGQVGGSNATHDPWTLGEYELYAQALQWAIFHHSQGNTVPQQMAERCPHYAKMLDNSLGAKPDTAPDTGEGDREKYYHIIKNCPECGEPTLQSHQARPRVSREDAIKLFIKHSAVYEAHLGRSLSRDDFLEALTTAGVLVE